MGIITDQESKCGEGVYKIEFTFPKDYPMSPPEIKFLDTIIRDNDYVDLYGCVCISTLKGDWTPAYTISALCQIVLSLLN